MLSRHTQRLGAIVLAGLVCICCSSGPRPSRSQSRDARIVPVVLDASVPLVRPAQRAVRLGPACRCEPVPADAAGARATARKVLVARIDGLNLRMRGLMQALDRSVPDEAKGVLSNPEEVLKTRDRLVCEVDCVLEQFVAITRPVWTYLALAARFLDEMPLVVARLAVALTQRPAGLSLDQLTVRFNQVARASNLSIGLNLFAPRPPALPLRLDVNSFRVKARRVVKAVQEAITDLKRSVPRRPSGAAAHLRKWPLTVRVALARLRQQLGHESAQAAALVCERGPRHQALQSGWQAFQGRLTELAKQARIALQTVRGAGRAGLAPAGAKRVAQSLDHGLTQWEQQAKAFLAIR